MTYFVEFLTMRKIESAYTLASEIYGRQERQKRFCYNIYSKGLQSTFLVSSPVSVWVHLHSVHLLWEVSSAAVPSTTSAGADGKLDFTSIQVVVIGLATVEPTTLQPLERLQTNILEALGWDIGMSRLSSLGTQWHVARQRIGMAPLQRPENEILKI